MSDGKLLSFINDKLQTSVQVLAKEDGSISISARDAAIGFGWTQIKAGKTYVKWERLNTFSEQLGFPHKWGSKDFMPESLFYRLGMKANNDVANNFQDWLANEVIPQIRKTGGYIPITTATTNPMSDAEIMASALLIAQKTIEARDKQLAAATTTIDELKPKADYTDKILASKNLMNVTQIAQDYGMSAIAFNKLLESLGIQYCDKRTGQWILKAKYKGLGWVGSTSKDITRSDGTPDVAVHTKWTQKGRLGLYNLLKRKGYIPVMESMHDDYVSNNQ